MSTHLIQQNEGLGKRWIGSANCNGTVQFCLKLILGNESERILSAIPCWRQRFQCPRSRPEDHDLSYSNLKRKPIKPIPCC